MKKSRKLETQSLKARSWGPSSRKIILSARWERQSKKQRPMELRLLSSMGRFLMHEPGSRLLMLSSMCGWHPRMVGLRFYLKCSRRTNKKSGLYEQQDENQAAHNLCGKFVTGEDGEYSFYAIRPTPYPIPSLGPAGKLLQLMDKPAFRPAHIHFMVLKEGYQPITTQLYDAESKYLENDAVCAVHDSLVVNFAEHTGDSRAKLEVKYDIRMAPVDSNGGMAQL
ncbi:unnamed protein product [Cercospora beticola]|nr:unnamed protein product [Cercospora beticola]